jgi:tRNA(fMet)-specific endonuclease VapC
MTRYLLDTNHLGEAIRPVSHLRDRIRAARAAGHVFGVCVLVLGEIEAGICQTAAPDEYRRRLRQILKDIRVWPLDPPVGRIYGDLFVDAQARGRTLGSVDLFLAALCRHMDLVLLTSDHDFDGVPEQHAENWLVAGAQI